MVDFEPERYRPLPTRDPALETWVPDGKWIPTPLRFEPPLGIWKVLFMFFARHLDEIDFKVSPEEWADLYEMSLCLRLQIVDEHSVRVFWDDVTEDPYEGLDTT